MRNPAANGGASTNATNGLDNATCSKIAAPPQDPAVSDPSSPTTPRAPTWQPIADVVARLLPSLAMRAIIYQQAHGDFAEAEAIRQTAQRVGVLP